MTLNSRQRHAQQDHYNKISTQRILEKIKRLTKPKAYDERHSTHVDPHSRRHKVENDTTNRSQ
jgi:hypothetical protein